MNRQLEHGFDKVVGYVGMLAICGLCAVYLTGCFGPAGYEIGGKLWAARIDEKQESSATVQAQTKPFKCHFVTGPECQTEAKGS